MVKPNLKKCNKNKEITQGINDVAPSIDVSSIGTTPSVPMIEAQAARSSVSSLIESRKRSLVWSHFTEYEHITYVKQNGKPDMEVIQRRAKCNYCPKGSKGDYAVESGKNGTGGMNRHIKGGCKYMNRKDKVDKFQKVLVGDKTKGNQMRAHSYNPKEVMQACVEMIVVDELPFSFVEKLGFRKFCNVVIPNFDVPCRKTLVKNFLNLYNSKRVELGRNLLKHRICLTTDTWTSVQKINYMVLTAHFIDKKWEMQKRIINFCPIHNHSGNSIGYLIEECMIKWGITKVLTITVDNAASNKCAIEYVRARLNRVKHSQALLEGKHMHVRCTAHICNLIVGSGLKKLNKAVLGIRNAVKFVRSSAHRLDVFKRSISKENISCKGLVVMDVPTRWNSTYMMLEAALKFKAAFRRMGEDEECFISYFKEPEEEYDEDDVHIPCSPNERGKCGPPSDDDWQNAEEFVVFLKVFYEVTLRVSASTHPTIHTTYHDVMSIEAEIERLIVDPPIIEDLTVTEKMMSEMAVEMLKKFNKYFGSTIDMNPFISLGLVLDPRFKLIHLTHLLKIQGYNDEVVTSKTKVVREFFMTMYKEYVQPGDNKQASERESVPNTTSKRIDYGFRSKLIGNWKDLVSSVNDSTPAHEVDKYLEDDLEPVVESGEKYPILAWWRLNASKYPVVAKIARDVLAIQVSTVASESAFSTGGRVIDNFRSSLTPTSVEALICLQSWLRSSDMMPLDDIPSIKDTELYEACEKEHILDLEDTLQSVPKTVNLCEDDSDGGEGDDDVGEDSDEESS